MLTSGLGDRLGAVGFRKQAWDFKGSCVLCILKQHEKYEYPRLGQDGCPVVCKITVGITSALLINTKP